MNWTVTAGLALGLVASGLHGRAGADAAPDFTREVQPILSENCYACHGPDDKARKAHLRFDVKAEALKALDEDYYAIVPGQPDKSALVERITTADEDDVMPPIKSGKSLSSKEKDILRRWIAAGADWPEHWAFVKPTRPEPPAVQPAHADAVRNEIDRFVIARAEREGLAPSPEAPKTTLIRRASMDLTGLPPTVEEVDAFLADGSDDAYEKLVDRLLDSPRYGEQQARYWLDGARYADTHGYHIDARRDIWAYREWVINAFNRNESFDQFTVEQLAGDLLPEPTTDQKVATGYIRCNLSTGEGGAIVEEYRAKYAFDRSETTAANWLGMTMVCARCHSHKYDPITQKEYYEFLAFFDNLEESVMDGNKPNPAPFIKLPSAEQTERLAWLKEHIGEAQDRVNGPDESLDAAQAGWARAWHERTAGGWIAPPIGLMRSTSAQGPRLWIQPDHSLLAAGANPPKDTYELLLRPAPGRLGGVRLEALPDASLPQGGSARAEDGRFALSEFEAELLPPPAQDGPTKPAKLKFKQALADGAAKDGDPARAIDGKANTAWSVGGEAARKRRTAVFLFDRPVEVAEGSALRVRLKFEADDKSRAIGRFRLQAAQGEALLAALEGARWSPWRSIGPFPVESLEAGLAKVYPPERERDFKATYDGVREQVSWKDRGDLGDGKDHLFVNELHGVHGAFYLHRTVHSPAAGPVELSLRADDWFKVWLNGEVVAQRTNDLPQGVAKRFRLNLRAGNNELLVKVVNFQGAKHLAFSATPAGPEHPTPQVAAILSVTATPKGPWARPVRDFYRRAASPEFAELFQNLAAWREEQRHLEAAIPTTMIAKEREKRRETHRLERGEYDKPAEVVEPGVPAFLPPLPQDAPRNRLGLARWLVSPDHPLTARVIVNRLWQQHFGTGLVKTAEDFGRQGERPSHPGLLDWLATEFIRSGWDVKHLHRLIVTSGTYRQDSAASPELIAQDPENRLLVRGPRFRMDAEELRDTALFVGGLLVERIGGPSVKPYEPPGLWEAVSYNNAQKYVPDRGKAQYRRSLYTFWKRQSPPPNMLLFDAPTREYCVVRRPRTNTPLQALVLLNDPQFVEASRAFAVRILQTAGNDASVRLTYAFRLATGRQPTDEELAVLLQTLRAEQAAYRADPESAKKLLEVGDYRAPAELDCCDLAAWTTVANLILNLDETLTKG